VAYLINNGRTNVVWQNAYLDQDNEFVSDRMPFPLIQMNPQDMANCPRTQPRRLRDGDSPPKTGADLPLGLQDHR
jgi:hypothetical protein